MAGKFGMRSAAAPTCVVSEAPSTHPGAANVTAAAELSDDPPRASTELPFLERKARDYQCHISFNLLHIGLPMLHKSHGFATVNQRPVGEQSRKTRLRDDLRPPGVRIFDSETVLSELGRIGSH